MENSLLVRLGKPRIVAGTATALLHFGVALFIILFAKSPGEPPPPGTTIKVPVSLVSPQNETTPADPKVPTSSQPTFERKRRPPKYRRVPSKRRHHRQPPPMNVMSAPPDETLDCSMFDDTSCSPCLADAATCKKCCGKKDTAGPPMALTAAMKGEQGTPCQGAGCTKGDPCTPEILSLMAGSFCPKVRRAVYARVGTTVLSGIGAGTFLSAQIAIAVSAAGHLSLASMLKSSGNSAFDAAVRKAVSSSSRVLPPASISSCVSSRGCVFSVTIGAKKVTASMSTVTINPMGVPPMTPEAPMTTPRKPQ